MISGEHPAAATKVSEGHDEIGDAEPGAVEDVLLQARRLLKEQLARHSAEQDRLLDRLLASARSGAPPAAGHRSVDSAESGEVEALAIEVALGAAFQADALPKHSSGACRKVERSPSVPASIVPSDRSLGPLGGLPTMLSRESEASHNQAFYVADPDSLPRARSTLEHLENSISHFTVHHEDEPSLAYRSLLRCSSMLHSLRTSREPERTGCLAKVISSRVFGALCMLCIGMNALFLVYVADHHMAHLDSDTSELIATVEMSFLFCYAIELAMKICVHRLYFFWCDDAKWNLLDFLLVCSSCIEMALASSAVNYSFMRSFRLFKVSKVMRVFSSVRFFSELRLVFDCILGSLCNLFWCLAMVVFVVYMFALLLVQTLASELDDHGNVWSQEQVDQLHSYFGSVGQAMLTLIQSTTGGLDWGDMYALLASGNDHTLPVVFLVYISFFALAAWNIVTALFVEKALKLAQPDIDTLAMERNIQDATDAEELTKMFTLLDADRSGTISLSELRDIMEHPKFRSCLRARGIEVTDADLFHRMMLSVADDPNQEVDIQFVVAACLRMKGAASSMDLHALSFESKLTGSRLRHYNREHLARLDRIERALAELHPASGRGHAPSTDKVRPSIGKFARIEPTCDARIDGGEQESGSYTKTAL